METEQERAVRLTKEAIEAININDNATARQLLEECMSIRQALGDPIGIAKTLTNLGIVDAQEGDESGARARWEQSFSMHRAANNPDGMLKSLCNLIGCAYRAGDYALMRSLEEQSVALVREGGDKRYLAASLDSLTLTVIYQQDYAYACRVQQESLAIKKAMDLREDVTSSLKLCAEIASAMQDCERSAVFYGAFAKQRALLARPQHPQEKEQLAADMAALESRMGEIPYRTAYSTGKLMTLEQAAEAATEFCTVTIDRKVPSIDNDDRI
jgi:hypothetical protein